MPVVEMPLYALGSGVPSFPDDGRYWVAPDATLIGDVCLARDASVWFGAVLRADNERIFIGVGSNVQDNCVLHADPNLPVTIGEYCTLGHGAIVHGCAIGDGSLVGMGATVLNGARVGRNCLIAANALISENAVIPDNSLVKGVPGKVTGELDNDVIRSLRSSAERYVEAWRRYRSDLRAIDAVIGRS